MDTPTWISRALVDAFHYMQLDEHGGSHGVRNENALESAVARPQQRDRYEPEADLATLAAAYAFGIATSHPYVDGNERTAFVVASIFLEMNGYEVGFTEQEVIDTMLSLADSMINEEQLGHWFRSSMRRLPLQDAGASVLGE